MSQKGYFVRNLTIIFWFNTKYFLHYINFEIKIKLYFIKSLSIYFMFFLWISYKRYYFVVSLGMIDGSDNKAYSMFVVIAKIFKSIVNIVAAPPRLHYHNPILTIHVTLSSSHLWPVIIQLHTLGFFSLKKVMEIVKYTNVLLMSLMTVNFSV